MTDEQKQALTECPSFNDGTAPCVALAEENEKLREIIDTWLDCSVDWPPAVGQALHDAGYFED